MGFVVLGTISKSNVGLIEKWLVAYLPASKIEFDAKKTNKLPPAGKRYHYPLQGCVVHGNMARYGTLSTSGWETIHIPTLAGDVGLVITEIGMDPSYWEVRVVSTRSDFWGC